MYWPIYTGSRQPMMGMTLSYMEGLVEKNILLVKTGSLIHVEFPEKLDFNTDTIKSITYSFKASSGYS